MLKNWITLQPPNSSCFKTIPSEKEDHGNETRKISAMDKLSSFIPQLQMAAIAKLL
jgi:hypothetical protein